MGSDLFYQNTRTWDLGKLEEMFYLWEAELVNQILVGEGSAEDFLVWPLTADGSYSVWSAYCFLGRSSLLGVFMSWAVKLRTTSWNISMQIIIHLCLLLDVFR